MKCVVVGSNKYTWLVMWNACTYHHMSHIFMLLFSKLEATDMCLLFTPHNSCSLYQPSWEILSIQNDRISLIGGAKMDNLSKGFFHWNNLANSASFWFLGTCCGPASPRPNKGVTIPEMKEPSKLQREITEYNGTLCCCLFWPIKKQIFVCYYDIAPSRELDQWWRDEAL